MKPGEIIVKRTEIDVNKGLHATVITVKTQVIDLYKLVLTFTFTK